MPICAKLYLSCFGSSNCYSVNRISCNTIFIMIAHISAVPLSCNFAVHSLFTYGNSRLFKMMYQLISWLNYTNLFQVTGRLEFARSSFGKEVYSESHLLQSCICCFTHKILEHLLCYQCNSVYHARLSTTRRVY